MDINIILEGLSELKAKISMNVIAKIQNQVQPQLGPPANAGAGGNAKQVKTETDDKKDTPEADQGTDPALEMADMEEDTK